jgi:hypothetical protein
MLVSIGSAGKATARSWSGGGRGRRRRRGQVAVVFWAAVALAMALSACTSAVIQLRHRQRQPGGCFPARDVMRVADGAKRADRQHGVPRCGRGNMRAAIGRVPGVTFLPFSTAHPAGLYPLAPRYLLVSSSFTHSPGSITQADDPAAAAAAMGPYHTRWSARWRPSRPTARRPAWHESKGENGVSNAQVDAGGCRHRASAR